MKKTVILLILTLMMVVSGMCYAAGDGSDLNRQQKVADKFMAVLRRCCGCNAAAGRYGAGAGREDDGG
ncbi:MAG: hypothetical protein ACLRXQ_07220 [Phascolarctobacterium faecium]